MLVTGEQGRIIHTTDGGATWELQPTITSSPLYSVAYRGGYNIWVAGRGGAILRRTDAVATVSIPTPNCHLRCGAVLRNFKTLTTRLTTATSPSAVPPDRKPLRP